MNARERMTGSEFKVVGEGRWIRDKAHGERRESHMQNGQGGVTRWSWRVINMSRSLMSNGEHGVMERSGLGRKNRSERVSGSNGLDYDSGVGRS